MPKTAYKISLKGYVGGYDFDRATVDKELAKNEGKQVNVLIDILGGSLATGLSISAAFKNHGNDNVHFVGLNDSAATIASLGTLSQFYDISHSKEYEVETGGLPRDECVQVEQMLTSPSVCLPWGPDVNTYEVDFDALLSILISDYTSEISDSDEKLNTVKFTWRFSDNRPKVEPPYSPGIFNNKFNPVFT